MRPTIAMLSVAATFLAIATMPARADLVGKTVDPSEMTTRAGGDDDGSSGAQVDSFWSDLGDSMAKPFVDVGNDFSNFGQELYHGHVGEAAKDLGNGVVGVGKLATGHGYDRRSIDPNEARFAAPQAPVTAVMPAPVSNPPR